MGEPFKFEDIQWENHDSRFFLATGDIERIQKFWDAVPYVPNIDAVVLVQITERPDKFNMAEFHRLLRIDDDGDSYAEAVDPLEPDVHACGTTHCLAGWACLLGGEKALELEARYGGDSVGAAIFAKSSGSFPNFRGVNEEALEEMRKRAGVTEEK